MHFLCIIDLFVTWVMYFNLDDSNIQVFSFDIRNTVS